MQAKKYNKCLLMSRKFSIDVRVGGRRRLVGERRVGVQT